MIEISKELLNNALKETIVKHNIAFSQVTDSCMIENSSNLMINYKTTHELFLGYIINIHELAHKCKEWAIKQGYSLHSCIHDDGSYERYYSICDILKPLYDSSCLFDTLLKTTEANTELEAIFKACQWILDNKKENKC